ncbi:hypothetical protein E2542_SST20544 [Spatholobus suberectus]|nr:hypothetical protein E2542_SST20544 [Spatholobus suberectus]
MLEKSNQRHPDDFAVPQRDSSCYCVALARSITIATRNGDHVFSAPICTIPVTGIVAPPRRVTRLPPNPRLKITEPSTITTTSRSHGVDRRLPITVVRLHRSPWHHRVLACATAAVIQAGPSEHLFRMMRVPPSVSSRVLLEGLCTHFVLGPL